MRRMLRETGNRLGEMCTIVSPVPQLSGSVPSENRPVGGADLGNRFRFVRTLDGSERLVLDSAARAMVVRSMKRFSAWVKKLWLSPGTQVSYAFIVKAIQLDAYRAGEAAMR